MLYFKENSDKKKKSFQRKQKKNQKKKNEKNKKMILVKIEISKLRIFMEIYIFENIIEKRKSCQKIVSYSKYHKKFSQILRFPVNA